MVIVMDGVTVICYNEKTFFNDRKELKIITLNLWQCVKVLNETDIQRFICNLKLDFLYAEMM